MKYRIPFSKPFISLKELAEIKKALLSRMLTSSQQNIKFENLFKKYLKTNNLTTTSNATSALDLAIKIIKPKLGDEIMTPSITWPSAINMIELNGCKPIFIDVDPHTFNLDLNDVKKKISKKTIAIMPVHFAGQAYDVDNLKKILINSKIKIIDDCSHAIGTFYKNAHVGANVDFAIFSFHPNKNITTAEGGLLLCKSKKDHITSLKLKYHGLYDQTYKKDYKIDNARKEVLMPGMKYILSDIHASIGIVQFKKLKFILKKRKILAHRYNNFIKQLKNIKTLNHKNKFKNVHSWHLFVIKFNLKKLKISYRKIFNKFKKNKIQVGVHYYPVHLHKYYKSKYKVNKKYLPNTSNLNNTYISLPLYPDLSYKDQDEIFKILKGIDNLE